MGRTILGTLMVAVGLLGTVAQAQLDNPNTFSFDGVLLDDATSNPMSGPVALKIQVYNPAANCLLFEEDHASVALDTNGAFSIRVGTGTRNTGADGGLAWKNIFSNKGVMIRASNGGTCGTSYTPAANDSRKIRVTVNGSNVLAPDFVMSTVPFATTADTLQGLVPSDLVLVSGGSAVNGFLKMNNQAAVRFADSGGTNYVAVRAPASVSGAINFVLPPTAGTSGQVLATDGAGNLTWTSNVPSATQIQNQPISATAPTNGQVLAWNGSTSQWMPMNIVGSGGGGGGTVTAVAVGPGLLGGIITTSGSISVDVGTTANKILQLNGAAQIPAVDGSLLTNVNAAQLATRAVSPVAPGANQFLGWNGTMWMPMTIAGTGGGTDNLGNHMATQNLVLAGNWLSGDGGNEGLVIDAVGRVGVGTNIPAIGASLDIFGVGSGNSSFLVPRDTSGNRPGGINGMIRYNTSLAKFEAFENGVWVNMVGAGGGGNATQIQGFNVSAVAPSVNQVLGWNGSSWHPMNVAGSGGGGSVTSVIAGAGLLGGAITTSGSIWVDVGTSPNKIVQLNGSAQLPAVDGGLLTNVSANRIQGNPVSGVAPSNGQILKFNGGTWNLAVDEAVIFPLMSSVLGSTSTPAYSFSGDGNTGMFSPSPDSLAFATTGLERLRLDATGNVGIGITAPLSPLHVHGTIPRPMTISNVTGSQIGLAFHRSGTDRAYLDANATNGSLMFDAGGDALYEVFIANTGRVGFGTTTPVPGAIADFNGTTSTLSSIIVPRDSSANRPVTGVNGMLRYNTDLSSFEGYESGQWVKMGPSPVVSVYAGRSLNSTMSTPAFSTSTTYYSAVMGPNEMTGTDISGSTRSLVPRGGMIKNFHVKMSQDPGSSWVYTLVKNGVDTAVTCTVTNGNSSCTDVANSFVVAPGDEIGIKLATGTTGAASRVSWAFELISP